MEAPHYFSPSYPPSDEALESAMGRFLIAWGILETQLDSSASVFLHVDTTLSLCITANLGTMAKIDMLKAAISMQEGAFEDSTVDEAHGILNHISMLATRFRNTLAHGQPTLWLDDEGDVWSWTRTSARKQLDVRRMPLLAERWEEAEREVKEVTSEWCQLYQDVWHVFHKLNSEDIEKLAVLYQREY